MKHPPKYDVFISYRREGADGTARLLYERLLRDGYRVAFDLETLRSGDFDEQILDAIRGCRDVVVVLAPGSLDRCKNDGDWVRAEIACALENGKNIIPVALRDFHFPAASELPENIRGLVRKQGISASMEHLDSSIERLKSFLTAHPPLTKNRHVIGWAANLVVLALFGAIIFAVWTKSEKPAMSQPTANPTPSVSPQVAGRPEWIPGTIDETRRGKRSETRGIWEPFPGWKVLRHGPKPVFEWNPGAKHPRHVHIHATEVNPKYGDGSGDWEPDEGYIWKDADSPRLDPAALSTPDGEHPDPAKAALLVPYQDTGMWIPGPHLAWKTDDVRDLSVVNDWTVKPK